MNARTEAGEILIRQRVQGGEARKESSGRTWTLLSM